MATPRLAPWIAELRGLPAGDRIVRLYWLVNDHRTALARLSIGPPYSSTERRRKQHERALRMLGYVASALNLDVLVMSQAGRRLPLHTRR